MTIADVDFDLLPEVFTEVQEHLPALEFDLHHLVRHIITLAGETEKFSELGRDATRISVDGAVEGWDALLAEGNPEFTPVETTPDDPALLQAIEKALG